MKKTINILFTVVFTVLTIGFTVNKHYSGGELFSLAIFSEPESCCADVCDCCDEESDTVQFLVNYTFVVDNLESIPGEVKLLAAVITITTAEPDLVITKTEFTDKDLPPPDNLTTLSFHQSFLL